MSEQNPDPKTHAAASKAARRYSEPFKADAVRLITHERYTFAKAANAVGVSEKSLRDWHRRLASPAAANPGADDVMLAENRRLREALRQAEMERDILKKAARFFANDTHDGSPSSRSKR